MQALVLSGGGAFGAYELGVLKALYEKGKVETAGVVTGTSVGAFNASILAMAGGGAEAFERLEDIWRHRIAEVTPGAGNGVLRIGVGLPSLSPLELAARPAQTAAELLRESVSLARIGLDRGAAFLAAGGGLGERFTELLDLSAFISVEPLRQTVSTEVSFEEIRGSAVKLRIVATDWEKGGYRVFGNAEASADAILASTAIPGVFRPVLFDSTTWVDGGVTMNTPRKPAIAAGADIIHVVSLDSSLHPVPASELDNTVEAMMRTVAIMISTAIREDMATADWINRGIAVLRRAAAGGEVSSEGLRDFTRVAAQLRERLVVHHYHPREARGSLLGLLDFSRAAIERLIAAGYADALAHDCVQSGCVVAAKE